MKEDKKRHPFLSSLPVWQGEDKTAYQYVVFDEASEVSKEMWDRLCSWYPSQRQIEFLNKGNKMTNLTDQEKKFVAAGGVIPSEVKKSDEGVLHFNIVLDNSSDRYWRSSDSRTTLISEMVDQHLINTMRFLMRNFERIKQQYLQRTLDLYNFNSSSDHPPMTAGVSTLVYKHKNTVMKIKTSASFYTEILPCFPTLAEEIVKRFGQRALRSLYDGE